jgi:pimeloyl-ACP methyl ester carboxylesterase
VKPTQTKVTTADGRSLDVAIAGPEDGDVVIAHTGTPSSGRVFARTIEAAAERGLRLVSYARPGYRDSDRHPGRSVADCAADVAAIADQLGVERFYTMGGSGGGPHALACAALLPDRVLSAASIAGAAPHDGEGLDWRAGMGEENVEEMGLAEEGAEALRPWLEREVESFDQASPEDLRDELGDLVSEVDRAALTGAFAEHVHASFHDAVKQGVWGWLDDDLAFVRPWGFDVGAIEVPVTVWQGGQDRFVPPAHGQWLADHVAGARWRLVEDRGHFSRSIADDVEILDDLLASAR